jgi:hypothetical protein
VIIWEVNAGRAGHCSSTPARSAKCPHLPVGRRLASRINRFVVEHTAEPKPFTWTADANVGELFDWRPVQIYTGILMWDVKPRLSFEATKEAAN